MPKKIIVRSYSPIAVYPEFETLWDDIYLTTTVKPGRKKLFLAPCIMSKKEFDSSYKDHIKFSKEYPEFDYTEEDEFYKEGHKKLDRNEVYIYVNEKDSNIDIVTPEPMINKKEAERLIEILMKNYGFDNIKCKWKRPKLFIISV